MIDRVARVDIPDNDQPVPIWMLNNRIDQINNALNQIQFELDWMRDEASNFAWARTRK